MKAMQDIRKITDIAVLAFGTIGDVLPVAVVAAKLATTERDCSITFVTHSAHEFLARPLTLSGVQFHPISSAPVSLPPGAAGVRDTQDDIIEQGGSPIGRASSLVENWRYSLDKQHHEECLSAVDQILGQEKEEGQGLIIFNFFALEGWHLAELFRVPCAVAAPYVVPYSAPASFERHFRIVQPLLYRRLHRAQLGEVGWSEVIHWMWPLFTSRWTEWRTDYLHLSACPLTDAFTELPVSHDWPRAPPLLYGFSAEVVECPDYWPKSIHVCGFWYAPAEWEALVSEAGTILSADSGSGSFPPKLVDFLSEDGNTNNLPLYIGLSSAGSMGYLKNPEIFLQVVLTALEAADRRAILFTASYLPLDSAVKVTLRKLDNRNMKDHPGDCSKENDMGRLEDGVVLGRLFCFSRSVSHNWLFPQLSLIIHHGGSGTTAAALRCGKPQVICPFMLDQFYWAERMTWIGVAPNPLKPNHLFPEGTDEFRKAVLTLKNAVEEASSTSMRDRAAALSWKIRQEEYDSSTSISQLACNAEFSVVNFLASSHDRSYAIVVLEGCDEATTGRECQTHYKCI